MPSFPQPHVELDLIERYSMLINSIYLQRFKCAEYKGDSNLPPIIFLAWFLSKSFSPIPIFDPFFSFLVYYSLISNITSAILKIFYLFLISSTVSIDFSKIYAFFFKSV